MLDATLPLPQPVALVLEEGAETLDRGLRAPDEELAAFRDFGLLTVSLPVSYGGQDWGLSPQGALPMFRLLVEIGAISLPLARLYEGHVNAVRLIRNSGTAEQKADVFDKVRRGALLGVWGADGSDPVKLSITAGGAALLSGRKIFASGIGQVSVAIVTATDEAGEHQMVLVDASDKSRQSPEDWDVSAMVGSVSGGFNCSALPITPANRLGHSGAMFQEPDFHGGLWRLCACYAGAMTSIAAYLAEKCKSPSVPHNDSLANHRLGQAIIAAQSATIARVLFAREAIEREAVRLVEIAERMCGTSIHFRSHKVGRTLRDLRFYLRQAGLDNKLDYAVQLWLKGHR
jgi:alkylation response protein AidB-like acyl-CoA dehydrogenase